MGILDFLFGKKKKLISQALKNGAIILDVRTEEEFNIQHVNGSINIPLDKLEKSIKKIKKANKPIMVCCASGIRSSSAVTYLKGQGVKNIFNAGSWKKIEKVKY